MARHFDELRAELTRTIDQGDARILKLEQDIADLQKQKEARGQTQGGDQAAQKEIDNLRVWVETLEGEQNVSVAQLSALPKMREPSQAAQPQNTSGSGRNINRSGLDFGRYFALRCFHICATSYGLWRQLLQ